MENFFLKSAEKIVSLIESRLWVKVIIGLFLGFATGLLLGPDFNFIEKDKVTIIMNWLALPGNLFLQIVKMIVIPLIFSSIIIGILSSGDPDFIKKIGPRLALYFVTTTVIAIVIGISVTTLINPGKYVNINKIELTSKTVQNENKKPKKDLSKIPNKIVNIVPSNPLKSMVSGDMLGVVIFTIFFGVALLFVDKKNLTTMISLLSTVQDVTMTIVKWSMALVPLAVFGLIAQVTSQIGFTALAGLGMYILSVLSGLVILIIFYNVIVFFSGFSPKSFMKKIRDVQLIAFSTSSSAAVMPLSIKTAEEKLGVKEEISQFIIPIGATINMDGTALYQVAATIFLSQVYGVDLSIGSILIISAVTVGASIGAPSAPGVGIVILASILESVGIPGGGIAMILGVDRILDMARTSVNVTGDLTASIFFNKRLSGLFSKE